MRLGALPGWNVPGRCTRSDSEPPGRRSMQVEQPMREWQLLGPTERQALSVKLSNVRGDRMMSRMEDRRRLVGFALIAIAVLLARAAWTAQSQPASQAGKTKNTVGADRKSTRLNSSHLGNSYAVVCLK